MMYQEVRNKRVLSFIMALSERGTNNMACTKQSTHFSKNNKTKTGRFKLKKGPDAESLQQSKSILTN